MRIPALFDPLRQLPVDPFAGMDAVFRGMDRASVLGRDVKNALDMRLDINEDDDSYVVNVDIPGIRKEDIDVSVEGNRVAIRAESRRELTRGKGKAIYNERYEGESFRAFTLPADVDPAKAKAEYDGGVLCLTLPKKQGGSTRHVPIN